MKLTKSALREIIKSVINEDLDKGNDDNCWDGYTQLGMKTKNGKEVPNCVPIKESTKLREMIGNVINEIRSKKNYEKI